MNIAVIGSGAWGTALAIRLCKNGHRVTLWTRNSDNAAKMQKSQHNPRLPGIALPKEMVISSDFA